MVEQFLPYSNIVPCSSQCFRKLCRKVWLLKHLVSSAYSPTAQHGLAVSPNLMPSAHRQHECLEVAVILDAYRRRGIGWALGRSLAAELALAARCMALAARGGGLS